MSVASREERIRAVATWPTRPKDLRSLRLQDTRVAGMIEDRRAEAILGITLDDVAGTLFLRRPDFNDEKPARFEKRPRLLHKPLEDNVPAGPAVEGGARFVVAYADGQ